MIARWPKFVQNDEVMIRRLGEGTPGEFRGKVVGMSMPGTEWLPAFYIVELIDSIPNYPWTHATFIASCIDSMTTADRLVIR